MTVIIWYLIALAVVLAFNYGASLMNDQMDESENVHPHQ